MHFSFLFCEMSVFLTDYAVKCFFMAESYKVKIKYDNREIKKVGQMGEPRRHKSTVQLTRVNQKKAS